MVFIWGGGWRNYSGISSRGDKAGWWALRWVSVLMAVRNNLAFYENQHPPSCKNTGSESSRRLYFTSSNRTSLLISTQKPAFKSAEFWATGLILIESAVIHTQRLPPSRAGCSLSAYIRPTVNRGSNTSLHPRRDADQVIPESTKPDGQHVRLEVRSCFTGNICWTPTGGQSEEVKGQQIQ